MDILIEISTFKVFKDHAFMTVQSEPVEVFDDARLA